MPYFIELSWDGYGNRGYTDLKPRIIEAARTDEHTLTVLDPDMSIFPWPNVHPRNWIEVQRVKYHAKSARLLLSGRKRREQVGDKWLDVGEVAKEVRRNLKIAFPKYKFSVTIERFSMGEALNVALMAAPFAVFTGGRNVEPGNYGFGYAQLNHHALRQEPPDDFMCNGALLTKEAWDTMHLVDRIANKRNWNNSDLQSDYHDVNFYLHLAIGKYDKPFVQNGANR